MDILSIAAVSIIAAAVANAIYREYLEQLPWNSVDGRSRGRETLAWLSDAEQTAIYARGTLTRHQWKKIQRRVARMIDASIGTVDGRGPATMHD